MSVNGDDITVSLELAIGVLLGFIIPILLYFWRMHRLAIEHKVTLEEHIQREEGFLDQTVTETSKVKYAVRELSHYMKWIAEEQTGKRPPPYVRNGD